MREVELSPDAAPIAREVHRRMRELGLGQKALATNAGLNETYVRDLFKGKSKNPRQRELSKLASALGCSLLDLTNPGEAGAAPKDREVVDDPDELALVRFWRKLTPLGRQLALHRLHRGAPRNPNG